MVPFRKGLHKGLCVALALTLAGGTATNQG
jgi:hypothetical protein